MVGNMLFDSLVMLKDILETKAEEGSLNPDNALSDKEIEMLSLTDELILDELRGLKSKKFN